MIPVVLAVLAVAMAHSAFSSPTPPTWPLAFEANYVLELPFVSVVQSVGLKVVKSIKT